MPRITILIGPPGSGKSTLAKAYEAKGFVRISQDDQGKGHMGLFLEALEQRKDIVVDRMNFDKQQRDRYRLPAKGEGYHISFHEVISPKSICFNRCNQRTEHPTIKNEIHARSALETFFSKYEELTQEELNFEYIRESYRQLERPPAIMVDLDGTLCNLNHRLHFVRGEGKKDWKSFFESMVEDTLYEDVMSALVAEHQRGTQIVLCSGRPDNYRGHTEDWLKKNMVPYTDLVMRPRNNYKSDDITKAMLYRYEIAPFFEVKYVLDDRDQVVNKWRSMGLTCFQVRPGDF